MILASAASTARSVQDICGLGLVRRSTATSCRSASISAFLADEDGYLNGYVVATSTQTGYNVNAVAASASVPLTAGTYETSGIGDYWATSSSSSSPAHLLSSPSVSLS